MFKKLKESILDPRPRSVYASLEVSKLLQNSKASSCNQNINYYNQYNQTENSINNNPKLANSLPMHNRYQHTGEHHTQPFPPYLSLRPSKQKSLNRSSDQIIFLPHLDYKTGNTSAKSLEKLNYYDKQPHNNGSLNGQGLGLGKTSNNKHEQKHNRQVVFNNKNETTKISINNHSNPASRKLQNPVLKQSKNFSRPNSQDNKLIKNNKYYNSLIKDKSEQKQRENLYKSNKNGQNAEQFKIEPIYMKEADKHDHVPINQLKNSGRNIRRQDQNRQDKGFRFNTSSPLNTSNINHFTGSDCQQNNKKINNQDTAHKLQDWSSPEHSPQILKIIDQDHHFRNYPSPLSLRHSYDLSHGRKQKQQKQQNVKSTQQLNSRNMQSYPVTVRELHAESQIDLSRKDSVFLQKCLHHVLIQNDCLNKQIKIKNVELVRLKQQLKHTKDKNIQFNRINEWLDNNNDSQYKQKNRKLIQNKRQPEQDDWEQPNQGGIEKQLNKCAKKKSLIQQLSSEQLRHAEQQQQQNQNVANPKTIGYLGLKDPYQHSQIKQALEQQQESIYSKTQQFSNQNQKSPSRQQIDSFSISRQNISNPTIQELNDRKKGEEEEGANISREAISESKGKLTKKLLQKSASPNKKQRQLDENLQQIKKLIQQIQNQQYKLQYRDKMQERTRRPDKQVSNMAQRQKNTADQRNGQMLDNEEGITSVQTSKATKIAKISKINYVSSRSILNRGKQKEPEMQVSGQKDQASVVASKQGQVHYNKIEKMRMKKKILSNQNQSQNNQIP